MRDEGTTRYSARLKPLGIDIVISLGADVSEGSNRLIVSLSSSWGVQAFATQSLWGAPGATERLRVQQETVHGSVVAPP